MRRFGGQSGTGYCVVFLSWLDLDSSPMRKEILALKQRILAFPRLLRTRGPEKDVPKRWVLYAPGLLSRWFSIFARRPLREHGEFVRADVGGQLFLWPRNCAIRPFWFHLSEILIASHPHQYNYGPTKIGPEDVVLDIGACEGSFSALVTARCKRVVAVEPSPSMCRLIEELFRLRKERCPQILKCLLGSEPGNAYFLEDADNPGASRITADPAPGALEVPVRTLDELVKTMEDKPTFIKCDAEGAEMEIFSGGKEFLKEFHPKLAITTYHNDRDYADLHGLLTGLGYRVMGKGLQCHHQRYRVVMIHAW